MPCQLTAEIKGDLLNVGLGPWGILESPGEDVDYRVLPVIV